MDVSLSKPRILISLSKVKLVSLKMILCSREILKGCTKQISAASKERGQLNIFFLSFFFLFLFSFSFFSYNFILAAIGI